MREIGPRETQGYRWVLQVPSHLFFKKKGVRKRHNKAPVTLPQGRAPWDTRDLAPRSTGHVQGLNTQGALKGLESLIAPFPKSVLRTPSVYSNLGHTLRPPPTLLNSSPWAQAAGVLGCIGLQELCIWELRHMRYPFSFVSPFRSSVPSWGLKDNPFSHTDLCSGLLMQLLVSCRELGTR